MVLVLLADVILFHSALRSQDRLNFWKQMEENTQLSILYMINVIKAVVLS